jgi:hypothetical protein
MDLDFRKSSATVALATHVHRLTATKGVNGEVPDVLWPFSHSLVEDGCLHVMPHVGRGYPPVPGTPDADSVKR